MGALLAQDPELARSLDRLGLTHAELVRRTEPHLDEIRRSATVEMEQFSILSTQLDEARVRQRLALLTRNGRIRNRWLVVIGIALSVLAFALKDAPPFESIRPWPTVTLSVIGAAILVVALARWSSRRANGRSLEREKADLDLLHNSVEAARTTMFSALVDRGLRPIVLQIRAKLDSPEYTTRLEFVSARGLSEIFDPTLLEVETPGVLRIREFLDKTPRREHRASRPPGHRQEHIDGVVRRRTTPTHGQPAGLRDPGVRAGRV